MKTNFSQGTLYLSIASIIFMLSGYLINIWLGRELGPAGYGIYGIIISLVTVVNLTQTAGLPQAVSKFVSADSERSEAIYRIGFIIQLLSTFLISVIFFLFSGTIASLLNDANLTPYFQLSAGIFPLYGLFALLTGYYNGLHAFKKQASLHIIYSLIKVLAIIILAYFFHLYGVILGFIISPFLALLTGFHIPKRIQVNFPYRKLIFFSLPLIGVAIGANLLQSIDLFFVKALLHSDKSAGFYTANQNIAEIPFFALSSLSTVLFPSISRHISQNRHDEAKDLITKSLRFLLLILIPGVLLISATSSSLLAFLFSKAYYPGAASLSILVIGSGFFTIFIILTTIISSSGLPLKSAILAGIGVVISSLLCYIFIPLLGLIGAALSTTLAAFLVMIIAFIIVYRKFHIHFPVASLAKIFSASLIVYLLARIITLPLFFLPLFYLLLLILYVALLMLLRELTKDDLILVQSLLPAWVGRKFYDKDNR